MRPAPGRSVRPLGEHVSTDPAWAAWDAQLKQLGVNPGTSADLTVTTLMLATWLA